MGKEKQTMTLKEAKERMIACVEELGFQLEETDDHIAKHARHIETFETIDSVINHYVYLKNLYPDGVRYFRDSVFDSMVKESPNIPTEKEEIIQSWNNEIKHLNSYAIKEMQRIAYKLFDLYDEEFGYKRGEGKLTSLMNMIDEMEKWSKFTFPTFNEIKKTVNEKSKERKSND